MLLTCLRALAVSVFNFVRIIRRLSDEEPSEIFLPHPLASKQYPTESFTGISNTPFLPGSPVSISSARVHPSMNLHLEAHQLSRMERWLVVELQKNSAKWTRVVDEVVRIEKKNFPKHESLAKSFDEELKKKNSGLLYAEVAAGGDVAGYVMYSMPSSLCATITKLAVKEGNRRQGLGEALMKAAIEKCRSRNAHRISLHVDPERVPAMKLYKRLGFQVDALIEGYYSSHRNAYRMYIDFDGN